MNKFINKEIQLDLSTIMKYVEELQKNPENISVAESLWYAVVDLVRHVKSLYKGYYVAYYEYGFSYDYSTVVYKPLRYMTYAEACDYQKSLDLEGGDLLDYSVKEVSEEQYKDFVYLRYLTKAYNALHELECYDKQSYTPSDIILQIEALREELDIPVYAKIH